MKRITAEDLYPMTVSPANFSKGDVVKKTYSDTMTTPFVGLVTNVIPSTNKVEVKWPYGIGLEEPWDLIKVNPLINPPVVQEDKAKDKYLNTIKNELYVSGLQHYSILNDFLIENMMPLLFKVADYYNEGLTKKEAFLKMKTASDHKDLVFNVINRVYNDKVKLVRSNVIEINGEAREASLSIEGSSDLGFTVAYSLGKNIESKYFESYRKAVEMFQDYENILSNLDNKVDYREIVSKVASYLKNEEETNHVGSVSNHIETIKLADIDILIDRLHKSLQEE